MSSGLRSCPLLNSLQYLSCLTTSRSLTDKLAFDVGLQEDSTGKKHLGTSFLLGLLSGLLLGGRIVITVTHQCAVLGAGEACWWTIHPASKQRSEGEKVRVGDDLILVSVSSERYLVRLLIVLLHSGHPHIHSVFLYQLVVLYCKHLSYASGDLMVDASFMQTLWNMNPITSGCELAEGTNLPFLEISYM